MMHRDLFRRHFNQNYSIEELEKIEQQKMALAAEQEKQWTDFRERSVARVLTAEQATTNHPLDKSKIMFRRHYYQKQCDSCFASKQANNQAGITYQNAMKEYITQKQTSPQSTTLTIPVRPKSIPFIVNVNPAETKTL